MSSFVFLQTRGWKVKQSPRTRAASTPGRSIVCVQLNRLVDDEGTFSGLAAVILAFLRWEKMLSVVVIKKHPTKACCRLQRRFMPWIGSIGFHAGGALQLRISRIGPELLFRPHHGLWCDASPDRHAAAGALCGWTVADRKNRDTASRDSSRKSKRRSCRMPLVPEPRAPYLACTEARLDPLARPDAFQWLQYCMRLLLATMGRE